MVIWTKTLDKELDYYYSLAPDTYIYVFKLRFNGGIRLIKEASERTDIKVYCGNVKRKTTKQSWFQHFTVGKGTPDIIYIRLSNGVRIYDYSKFDPSDDPDPAEAMELCEMLVNRFQAPYSPTKIIRAAIPLLNKVQGKNEYGVQVKSSPPEVRRFARQAFFGGAVANITRNGGYRTVPHETHVDYHQMYASIMYTKDFPDIEGDYTILEGYHEHPMAIYWIGGGRIKLKKTGFPLLSIDRLGSRDSDVEEKFKKYAEIP